MNERGNRLFRALDVWAGIPATACASLWRRCERKTSLSPGVPQKIGIICLGAIGDLLMLTGLLKGLRARWPDSHMEIIASRANAAALPLLPGVNSTRVFPVARIDRIISYLRSRKYDILFDSTQWARIGNILANFSGAGLTVGFLTPGQKRSLGYGITVPHSNTAHEWENFLALGKSVWPELAGFPCLELPEEEIGVDGETAEELLAKAPETVYCHMWARGSGAAFREWPRESWRKLIAELTGMGCQVAISGSSADRPMAEGFKKDFFPDNERIRVEAGRTSLVSLARCFQQARGVVAIATGIMHLADLAGAPLVALFGPTNTCRWGPLSNQAIALSPRKGLCGYINLGFEYPKNAVYNMGDLPVTDVLGALEKLGVIRN